MNCPYCFGTATLSDTSTRFYGRDLGPVWACLTCDARVGCHPGTTKPLGTLADAATRRARGRAHSAFDLKWRRRGERSYAYAWLADQLELEVDKCHIALFDVQMCERVVKLCAPMVFE